jgi:hypothetical protein
MRATIVTAVLAISSVLPFEVSLSAQTRAPARWAVVEETTIPGSISGSVSPGRVFRTASGSIYEVTLALGLILELSPRVTVLSNGQLFRLIIDGFDEEVYARQLAPPRVALGATADSTGQTASVIETRVDGEFEGFDGSTIIKLMNGQIWEQIDARYRYRYRYSPKVIIIRDGSGYRMQVESIDEWVRVRRLK